jgi:two-component system NtrC family sensor kinase
MGLRLISKLTITTSIVLLVTMILFAILNIRTQKGFLLDEAVADADKLSETIIRSAHHQMLENELLQVYQMIREVGTLEGVEKIRLINKSGRIIFSTDSTEIGITLEKNAESCNVCHAGEQPLTMVSTLKRSRLITNDQGKQFLGMAKAIYNQEACASAACHFHPRGAKMLGILDITVSLDKMRSQLATYRERITYLTIFLLVLLTLCLTLFTQMMVNRPVKSLLQHTRLLAKGNLDGMVRISSRDELGELATGFNEMTRNLKRARAELEDWGKNLEVKVEERTSEISRMQEQLVRSEKLASLGELVAGIAHEINNPLTGILFYSSMVSKDPRLDPVFTEDLQTITRETQRCAKIVKGLLDFARESIPQKNWTSLNGIIEAAFALVEHQSIFLNVSISKQFHENIPAVFVDPNQIEQVLINMLINAGQAMNGYGNLSVKTDLSPDGYYASITIRDSGCGIPPENLTKIFDPFFTTKETKGTGLGLSVSYGIIKNHGGEIYVQSVPDEGTTFTIDLPLMQDEEKDLTRSMEEAWAAQFPTQPAPPASQ